MFKELLNIVWVTVFFSTNWAKVGFKDTLLSYLPEFRVYSLAEGW